jgi:hypothetical protein
MASPVDPTKGGKVNLDRVTITGADDSISPENLIGLTEKYPFVEWGILFSSSRQGTPRYPSDRWIENLSLLTDSLPNLSAHLCGKFVRDLVLEANPTWWGMYDRVSRIFNRVQLNFHGQFHKAAPKFSEKIMSLNHEFILQHDGENDETILKLGADLPVFPLFDRSGGAGVVPGSWPKPIWKYQGYAGGLGPENIEDELHRISDVVGDSKVWIDMETRVRSNDDRTFDLKKVEACLRLTAPFVNKEKAEVKCRACGRVMSVAKADADDKWLCAGCALGDEGDNG